jgi:hypothetical protein
MHSMRLSSKWHMHRVHLLLGAEALVNLFLCSLFGFSMSYASRRTRTRSYGLVSKRPLDHLGVSLQIPTCVRSSIILQGMFLEPTTCMIDREM